MCNERNQSESGKINKQNLVLRQSFSFSTATSRPPRPIGRRTQPAMAAAAPCKPLLCTLANGCCCTRTQYTPHEPCACAHVSNDVIKSPTSMDLSSSVTSPSVTGTGVAVVVEVVVAAGVVAVAPEELPGFTIFTSLHYNLKKLQC